MKVVLVITMVVFITAQTKPLHSNDAPVENQASKEEAAQILFGERGILTGIFRMMDQQRKIQPAAAPQHDTSDNGKIGNFDFKKIVDTLVMGAADKGELGDQRVELPEFLGICNRLSCGDIYKAIDKFRKSEMFSNFQTALTLVQDPNGWETIGKLLSNPELISQFTAGSGMEELFGSALGEVKKESNITRSKNSKLMPEDGDFGIDFSEDGETENVTKIEFSVDKKAGGGGSEDYYSEVSNAGDDSAEYETVDEKPPPPSTKITKENGPDFSQTMPPISFSIDEGGDENEAETVNTAEVAPTKIIKRIHAGSVVDVNQKPVETMTVTRTFSTTRMATTTTTPIRTVQTIRTTTRPTTTTTIRNFRKDNDYYAMYYDDKL
ncbi:unnamed protein product [Caenorhabditis angaria]|uniref:SPK domain-containing protein n=1 Tax=Caenorhabditis angaria TaxID=860376 RepID=A0A9P1J1X7_9PELO|nr:unnamed protein product [Caenorhabditis angaria]